MFKNPHRSSGFAFVFVVGVALPFSFYATQYIQHGLAAARERTTAGVLTAHEPQNHNRYEFSYMVAGQSLRAWDVGTVNCDQGVLAVGNTVTVYYDPRHPDDAHLCSFAGTLKDERDILVLLCVFGGFLALVGKSRARPSKKTVTSPSS